MPTYDYRCLDCGSKFSAMVKIDDRDKVKCRECESPKVEQMITGCAFKTSSSSDRTAPCGAPAGSGFS